MAPSSARERWTRQTEQFMFEGCPTDQHWHCMMSGLENAEDTITERAGTDEPLGFGTEEYFAICIGGYELMMDSGYQADAEDDRQEGLGQLPQIASVDLGGYSFRRCACGCNEMTPRTFRPGHDMRAKALVVKAGRAYGTIQIVENGVSRLVTAAQYAHLVLSARTAHAVCCKF